MTVSYVGRGESLSWVYGVDNVNIPNSDVVDSPFNDFTQFDNMDFSANYNSILSRENKSLITSFISEYNDKVKRLSADENILSGKKLLSNRRQRSSSIHFKDAWGGGDKSGRINAQKNVEINKKMEGIYIGFTQRTIESQTENQSVVFKSSKHEMVENKLIYLASLANELSKLNDSISDENLKYSINKVVGEVLELKLKKIQKMAKSSKCNFSFSNLKKDLAMLSSLAVTGIAAGVIPTFIATGAVAAIAPILAALGCAIYAFNPQLKETETSKLLDASIKDIGATLGSELKDEKLGRFEYLRHKYAAYKYRKAAKHTFDG